jgi:hypothetical protein
MGSAVLAAYGPRMDTRSPSLLLSVVLVALTGVAALFVAVLLLAVASGAIPLLAGGVHPFVWILAAVALAFGVAGVLAATGLWQRLAWAWPLAAGVLLVGTLGAVIAIATSGPQLPTLLGLAMVAVGLAAVAAPDTRRALAI